ncbi:hypothetical protein Nizo2776_2943 [Lactiplantibacillus plantarum]|nr:hypothetical protein Nizo2776_2943 [Lactiplantibacillus plantarum]
MAGFVFLKVNLPCDCDCEWGLLKDLRKYGFGSLNRHLIDAT